jgi:hypothetical protein
MGLGKAINCLKKSAQQIACNTVKHCIKLQALTAPRSRDNSTEILNVVQISAWKLS